VQKDGSNTHFRYRFVSAANVLGHVNDALAAAGLAVVGTLPQVVSVEGTGKDRIVTVSMTVTVADTESPERASFVGLGSGMDTGDKAVMKAQTAALKYAWLGAFSISTGDDPEADAETDKRTTQAQKKPADKPAPREERPAAAEPGDLAAAPAELEGFLARVGEVELPGEAVAVWMKHRAEIAKMPAPVREYAWNALRRHTERVGKMKNAQHWLAKAVKEEDARRTAAPTSNGAAS
jgi:hypothetical protein